MYVFLFISCVADCVDVTYKNQTKHYLIRQYYDWYQLAVVSSNFLQKYRHIFPGKSLSKLLKPEKRKQFPKIPPYFPGKIFSRP